MSREPESYYVSLNHNVSTSDRKSCRKILEIMAYPCAVCCKVYRHRQSRWKHVNKAHKKIVSKANMHHIIIEVFVRVH